jgi:zinc transport system ATP-binding protein
MTEPILAVEHLSFAYDSMPILGDVSFSLSDKSFCALVGPNGSGKSTLLRCITGLSEPDSGTVSFRGKQRDAGKRPQINIGYVEQRLFISQDFPITVFEVVASGRIGNKRRFSLSRDDKKIVHHSIESVGLTEFTNKPMSDLSGGQQQRVLIAKAFASEPELLILDEPTAGVDGPSQKLFADALSHIIEEHKTTVLLVSHELSAVSHLLDHVIVLKNKIVFDGKPEDLEREGVSLGIHVEDLPRWLEGMES